MMNVQETTNPDDQAVPNIIEPMSTINPGQAVPNMVYPPIYPMSDTENYGLTLIYLRFHIPRVLKMTISFVELVGREYWKFLTKKNGMEHPLSDLITFRQSVQEWTRKTENFRKSLQEYHDDISTFTGGTSNDQDIVDAIGTGNSVEVVAFRYIITLTTKLLNFIEHRYRQIDNGVNKAIAKVDLTSANDKAKIEDESKEVDDTSKIEEELKEVDDTFKIEEEPKEVNDTSKTEK